MIYGSSPYAPGGGSGTISGNAVIPAYGLGSIIPNGNPPAVGTASPSSFETQPTAPSTPSTGSASVSSPSASASSGGGVSSAQGASGAAAVALAAEPSTSTASVTPALEGSSTPLVPNTGGAQNGAWAWWVGAVLLFLLALGAWWAYARSAV